MKYGQDRKAAALNVVYRCVHLLQMAAGSGLTMMMGFSFVFKFLNKDSSLKTDFTLSCLLTPV